MFYAILHVYLAVVPFTSMCACVRCSVGVKEHRRTRLYLDLCDINNTFQHHNYTHILATILDKNMPLSDPDTTTGPLRSSLHESVIECLLQRIAATQNTATKYWGLYQQETLLMLLIQAL